MRQRGAGEEKGQVCDGGAGQVRLSWDIGFCFEQHKEMWKLITTKRDMISYRDIDHCVEKRQAGMGEKDRCGETS